MRNKSRKVDRRGSGFKKIHIKFNNPVRAKLV